MDTFSIIPYERKHRDDVLSLLYESRRLHSHLDWYKAGRWLDMPDVRLKLAWQGDTMLGYMGVSPILNHTTWLRLVALRNDVDPTTVLVSLWRQIRQELQAHAVQTVVALVMNRWLLDYLPALGFHYLEDVVTLQRTGRMLPQPDIDMGDVSIRHGYNDDLLTICDIDHAAFNPPWQMSLEDLRQSQRQAASCTIAEIGDEPVGYQLSTRHHNSAHLARLAVVPGYQGRGIGAILLDHLIRNFMRRSVRSITVNTQASNLHSQSLYRRYGFHLNGFDLPLWWCTLKDDHVL